MKRLICGCLLFLAHPVFSLHAEIVFHETFAKGRETQNPPESLAWWAIIPNSVTVEGGSLKLSGEEKSFGAIVASFPTVQLSVGDRLVLSFHYELSGEVGHANDALRVGLYALPNPPAGDGENPRTDGSGYVLAYANARHSGNDHPYTGVKVSERVDTGGMPGQLTSFQDTIPVAFSGLQPGFYEAGVPYTVEFQIERVSEDSLRFAQQLSGGTFSQENDLDATTQGSQGQIFTEFDTVAFMINASGNAGAGGFAIATFSDIKLEVIRK